MKQVLIQMLWHEAMRMIDFGLYHKYIEALVRKNAWEYAGTKKRSSGPSPPPIRSVYLSVLCGCCCCFFDFLFAVEPFTFCMSHRAQIYVLLRVCVFFSSSSLLLLLFHFLHLHGLCWFFIFAFWYCCCCCYLFAGPSLTDTTLYVDSLWISIRFAFSMCACGIFVPPDYVYAYKYMFWSLDLASISYTNSLQCGWLVGWDGYGVDTITLTHYTLDMFW